LLRELGHDPKPMLASLGLDLKLFDDPENIISFITGERLLKLCAQRTRTPHFGLLFGQRAGLESLGLLGRLGQHSADVGSALRSLVCHLGVHDRGGAPTLTVRDGVAMLGYAINQPKVEGISQIQDGSVAIICNIMRSFFGDDWAPSEVLFSRTRPTETGPYRHFFRAPLRFDADQTALVFPANCLAQQLPGADARLRRLLEARIAALHWDGYGDVVDQVRRVLRPLLVSGKGSLERVAQLISMHRRTLNRRLRDHGTTFKALLEETRFEIAKQLLADTLIPVIEIATTLDYADASAFTRAFRRWSATTPAAWRPQYLQPVRVSPDDGQGGSRSRSRQRSLIGRRRSVA
jgi:AraC-like DNA-binding protein